MTFKQPQVDQLSTESSQRDAPSGGNVGVIERAFQMAPECRTLEEIRGRLRKEGYAQVDAHMSGRGIRADLRNLLNTEGSGT